MSGRSIAGVRRGKAISRRRHCEVEGSALRNTDWVAVGGDVHAVVRCSPRPRVSRAPSEPLSAPRPGSALRASLCQEESLPGHRGSPAAAMQRMSPLSAGRTVLRTRLLTRPHLKDTPRHAPSRGAPSPRQRDYRRRALFILSRVPGNSAGRRSGAPP